MTKRIYNKPQASEEIFMSNEYVAACYDYNCKVVCALPGSSTSKISDGTSMKQDSDKQWHGLCGNWSSEFMVNGVAGGYETVDGVVDRNRPITNIQIGAEVSSGTTTGFGTSIGSQGELKNGGWYKATWTSTDGKTGYYHHYGCLQITSEVIQIPGRPNHS